MVAGSLGTINDGLVAMAAGMASKAKLTGKALKEKMRNAVVWLVNVLGRSNIVWRLSRA
jgi:hypothetical protein